MQSGERGDAQYSTHQAAAVVARWSPLSCQCSRPPGSWLHWALLWEEGEGGGPFCRDARTLHLAVTSTPLLYDSCTFNLLIGCHPRPPSPTSKLGRLEVGHHAQQLPQQILRSQELLQASLHAVAPGRLVEMSIKDANCLFLCLCGPGWAGRLGNLGRAKSVGKVACRRVTKSVCVHLMSHTMPAAPTVQNPSPFRCKQPVACSASDHRTTIDCKPLCSWVFRWMILQFKHTMIWRVSPPPRSALILSSFSELGCFSTVKMRATCSIQQVGGVAMALHGMPGLLLHGC